MARALAIGEQTYYRKRKDYGGLRTEQAQWLKVSWLKTPVLAENPIRPTSNPATTSETLPIVARATGMSAATHCGGHEIASAQSEFPIDSTTPIDYCVI